MNSENKSKPWGYWKGKEGLERAKEEIIKWKNKFERTPKLTEVTGGIYSAIKVGHWKEFGITNWLEFLDYCQIEHLKRESRKWKGEEGLEKAKRKYIEISKQIGKRPTSHHVSGINKAIKRGVWRDFGIVEWEDFVIYCGFKPKTKMGTWTGKEGLEKAKQKFIEISKQIGKRPTIHQISGIVRPIKNGVWTDFRINDWEDFVIYCGFKPDTKKGTWGGKQGLERAVKELTDFYILNNRIPTIKDVSYGIIEQSYNGNWNSFCIESWNDLIEYCGFDVNIDHNKWKGKKGLDKAKEKILAFVQEYNKNPKTSDKGFRILSSCANRGYWKEYSVTNWKELIKYCELELTKPPSLWRGEEGLKRAQQEILKYFKEHNRVPRRHNVSGGIFNACQSRYWEEFGISSWNNLVISCNLEPTFVTGKWKGSEGLEKARKLILEYYKKHGKSPAIKNIPPGIYAAVQKEYWKEFDISSWNELLEYFGLEPLHEIGIWIGRDGLERAKQALLEIYQSEGKTPTIDEVPGGIYSAIERKEWIDFGFTGNTWNEFVIFCGLEPNKGFLGDAWLKWEKWCGKALNILYPQRLKTKPKLPNGKIPDFLISLTKSNVMIIDSKLSAFTTGIKHDIKYYSEYCYRLEFWCLFGQRENKMYNGKEICFLKPDRILKQIKDIKRKEELKNELKKIYEYAKKEFIEISIDKITKDELQKTLDYWLGDI